MKIQNLVLLGVILLISYSCSKEDIVAPKEVPEFIGKWELVDVQMSVFPDAYLYAKDIGSELAFNSQNNFTLIENNDTISGQWNTSTSNKTLILTASNDFLFCYDEYEVLDGNLHLTYYIPNDSSHLIYQYYETYIKE